MTELMTKYNLEIFCNISVFTVIFDQLGASLLDKNINFFQKKKLERVKMCNLNFFSSLISNIDLFSKCL